MKDAKTMDVGTIDASCTPGPTPRAQGGAHPARPGWVLRLAALGLSVLAPASVKAQSGVAWTQRMVSGPSPRADHAMAYDAARGVTVLFGGANGGDFYADTWEWNGTTWTQRDVPGPSPRWGHGLAYDSVRHVMVMYGGYTYAGENNETWEYDGTAWTQIPVVGPIRRYWYGMAYDSGRHVTVLFGGWRGNFTSDTWEWDGTTWTRIFVTGPTGRYAPAMVYDSSHAVSVLFGGSDVNVDYVGDTWTWNGAAWTQQMVTGPSPRYNHAMCYDSARNVAVLFAGGSNFQFTQDTWEWNGTAWNELVIPGPSKRVQHAMAFDSGRGVSVLFGGNLEAGPDSDETWELGAPCAAASIGDQPMAQSGCLGGSASFAVSASGAEPISYAWRKDSAAIDTMLNPSAATATLSLGGLVYSDAGAYDVVVSNACGSATSNAAMLTICVGDFNCDGGVDGQDVQSFFEAWEGGTSAGDVNGDGGVDGQDVEFFFVRWEGGC